MKLLRQLLVILEKLWQPEVPSDLFKKGKKRKTQETTGWSVSPPCPAR